MDCPRPADIVVFNQWKLQLSQSLNTMTFNIRIFASMVWKIEQHFSGFGQSRKSLVFKSKCLGFCPTFNVNVLYNCTNSLFNSPAHRQTLVSGNSLYMNIEKA